MNTLNNLDFDLVVIDIEELEIPQISGNGAFNMFTVDFI
jgi:hypothetical protein